ncbi:MAG TPA: nucleotide pyrophosphatase/phosphodiesterase family protein [Nitrospiraceae bacterium]|nr:nucleotide pyrophosphatase/phosphodiesterase family protein [Nitrospiraceae bacterium]
MYRTVVLNVVGLTPSLVGDATPHLSALVARGGIRPLMTVLPAVTCSVQSTFTTGLLPRDHGCVGNGWYFRDLSEIRFWQQSNSLVRGEKIWESAARRDPAFTCAKLFWWFNMYSTANYTVTPRPLYPADGRKIPDLYTQPAELRTELTDRFGTFPLFHFWGPTAGIASSRWISDCARYLDETRQPTLMLVYLPHLDYNLQRLGNDHPDIRHDLTAIDALCGDFIEQMERQGGRIIILSEYGVTPVRAPIHINRVLREAKWLRVRSELGHELLDAGASDVFAVADHQIAHVYVKNRHQIHGVQQMLQRLDGIERVLDHEGQRAWGLDHPRSGELVAIAEPDRWFTYYYWLDDRFAPDFARTVDIHRKPGYDPVELFLDPSLRFPRLHLARRVLQKTLGFRYLMDVIPLDAQLVKGSHGRVADDPAQGPLVISSEPSFLPAKSIHATEVKDLVLRHVFDGAVPT